MPKQSPRRAPSKSYILGRDFDMFGRPVSYGRFDCRYIDERPVVDNTTEEDPVERNPYGMPVASAVLAQEARGVAQLVGAQQMSKDLATRDKEHLEALGFKIHRPTPGDDLFYDVTLPEGWKKEYSREDSRTINFIDPQGRIRIFQWYKGASYDRSAYGALHRRFSVTVRHFEDYTVMQAFVCDRKNPKREMRVVHASERMSFDRKDWSAKEEAEETLRKGAVAWAASQGIDIDNPLANWDDEDLPTVCDFPDWNLR